MEPDPRQLLDRFTLSEREGAFPSSQLALGGQAHDEACVGAFRGVLRTPLPQPSRMEAGPEQPRLRRIHSPGPEHG
jgi:hypothetical protein